MNFFIAGTLKIVLSRLLTNNFVFSEYLLWTHLTLSYMIKIEIYSTNLLVTIYATCQLDYTDLEEVKVFKKKKKKKKNL